MRSVLITGASSGIGLACTEVFATSGRDLILNARKSDRLGKLSDDLRQEGIKVFMRKPEMKKWSNS